MFISSFREKPKKSHHMLICLANFPWLILSLTSLTLSLCHCFLASHPGSYTHFFVLSKEVLRTEKKPTLVSEIKMSARNTVHSTENQPTPVGVGITRYHWVKSTPSCWMIHKKRERKQRGHKEEVGSEKSRGAQDLRKKSRFWQEKAKRERHDCKIKTHGGLEGSVPSYKVTCWLLALSYLPFPPLSHSPESW